MKYRDLIKFDPIIDVVQLTTANKAADAERLVRTYVLSEKMAERLTDIVVPQLQFDKPAESKGMLVVGNYGTGKSHLMSVLTTIAENPEAPTWLQDVDISKEFAPVAGKFKVLRTELGGITMSLREFLFRKLDSYLESISVDYKFPKREDIESNKDCLNEMMSKFQEVYPDQGLLVAIDELLDFLRSKNEQDLYMDLNILREIGEVCMHSRFRFIAGVQETLFENPKFQFVADTMRRVRDRFETVTIFREDVAYVVSNRLLKKDSRQKDLIRTKLEKFAPYFSDMQERMDLFVRLYPIHPDYLDVFERISIVEKREVLRTISRIMDKKLDEEVPEDNPGIISYDSYWDYLANDPSAKSIEEVSRVIECYKKLEGIIQSADMQYQNELAIRIIKGLAVYRLTTDIGTKNGLTPKNLRDQLCIYLPGQLDEEFLEATVESVLKNIMKVVSGQFISANKENQQYYLDVDKDIDYDSLVDAKAAALTEDRVSHYYFDLLINLLETGDSLFTGFRIWEFELDWPDRKTTRQGWLFFGAPHERSTAQPPKDFYIYFLNIYGPQAAVPQGRADEVFFALEKKDEAFLEKLRLYAGAREMETTSSVDSKIIYRRKVEELRKQLNTWFSENIASSYKLHYQGKAFTFTEMGRGANRNLDNRSLIKLVASNCLQEYFNEQAPSYPTFPFTHCITKASRPDYAADALRWISDIKKTDTGARIVDGLDLMHENDLKPGKSRYTKFILNKLPREVESVQVVNRSDLIKDVSGIEYSVEHRLEPEWVVVLLAALVKSGEIVISYPGLEITASNLEDMSRKPMDELVQFKCIRRPGKFPLKELIALCKHLGVNETKIRLPEERPAAIQDILKVANERVQIMAKLVHDLGQGIQSFGVDLLDQATREAYRRELDNYKAFLENLEHYNTPAKLGNFKATEEEIAKHDDTLRIIEKIKRLKDFKDTIDPIGSYLQLAETVMGSSQWVDSFRTFRTKELLPTLGSGDIAEADQEKLERKIRELKREYIETYTELHKKHRLNAQQDNAKQQLYKDTKLEQLKRLKDIELMPTSELDLFTNKVAGLRTCFSLDKTQLEKNPICSSCDFRPSGEKLVVMGVIDQYREELEKLYHQWQDNLLATLKDPSVVRNFELLKPNERKRVEEFKDKGTLPEDLDSEFVSAVRQLLSDMKRVDVTAADIRDALLEGGSPCTVDELRARFERFLRQKTEGSPDNTRIILHEEEQQ